MNNNNNNNNNNSSNGFDNNDFGNFSSATNNAPNNSGGFDAFGGTNNNNTIGMGNPLAPMVPLQPMGQTSGKNDQTGATDSGDSKPITKQPSGADVFSAFEDLVTNDLNAQQNSIVGNEIAFGRQPGNGQQQGADVGNPFGSSPPRKIITTTINNSKCYRRNSNNLKIRLAECRTMACQIITCQMHLASNNNKCHQHHVNNNKCRLGEG